MNSDFWTDLWKTNDIPWNLSSPDPLLVRHFPNHASQNVFVPLCGKSVDMLWLQGHGHKVFGVELSDIACRSFFSDAKIEYKTTTSSPFEIFTSPDIRIWCGDFFGFQSSNLPPLDFIYDRAALIALPPELRKRYSQRIIEISRDRGSSRFEMLVILREKVGSDHKGPPFSVSFDELKATYDECFLIEQLEVLPRPSKEDPKIEIVDTVYRLKLK